MGNRKIILIGKNGSGKTRYLGDKFFGKHLKAKEVETISVDKSTVKAFGGLQLEKGIILYIHTLALQEPLVNKNQEFFTNIIEKNNKYSLVEIFSKIAEFKSEVSRVMKNTIDYHFDNYHSGVHSKSHDRYVHPINERVLTDQEQEFAKKHPMHEPVNFEDKVAWSLKNNRPVYNQNEIWKPMHTFLPQHKIQTFYEMLENDLKINKCALDFIDEFYMKKIMSELVTDELVSTRSSISQIKELYYQEIMRIIIETHSNTEYDESKMEIPIIASFNEIAELASLPLVLTPTLKDKSNLKLSFLFNGEELSFERLSTGQRALINIISQIVINSTSAQTTTSCTILEEFDAFLNSENISELIPLFTKLDTTLILTTHNPTTLFLFDDEPKVEYYKTNENDVIKISKIEGQKHLLNKAKNISINTFKTITIFTEAPNDAEFLSTQYEQVNNSTDYILNFVSISPDKDRGGKSKIDHFKKEMGPELPKYICFIKDFDGIEQEESNIFINDERYSLENFLYDPELLKYIFQEDTFSEEFYKMFPKEKTKQMSMYIDKEFFDYELPISFLNSNLKKQKQWIEFVDNSKKTNAGNILCQLKKRHILFNSWKNKITEILDSF